MSKILTLSLISCAGLIFALITVYCLCEKSAAKSNETEDVESVAVSATLSGASLKINQPDEVATQIESMIVNATGVYSLAIPTGSFKQWQKTGFIATLTFANSKEFNIPVLSDDVAYYVTKVTIIETKEYKRYIIVNDINGNNYVLATTAEEISNLKKIVNP